ncbi:hypothetical protein FZC66_10535 [Priestia megaterium]|nr:hypothetical protein FZC66_10535 [Priestia megaterium]
MELYQNELKEYVKFLMPKHLEKMKKMYSSHPIANTPALHIEKRKQIEQVVMSAHTACQPVTLQVYEAGHVQRYERVTIDEVALQSNTLFVTGPYYTYSIRADLVIEADLCQGENYS